MSEHDDPMRRALGLILDTCNRLPDPSAERLMILLGMSAVHVLHRLYGWNTESERDAVVDLLAQKVRAGLRACVEQDAREGHRA